MDNKTIICSEIIISKLHVYESKVLADGNNLIYEIGTPNGQPTIICSTIIISKLHIYEFKVLVHDIN